MFVSAPSSPEPSDPCVRTRPIRLLRWSVAIGLLLIVAWLAGAIPRWRARASASERTRHSGAPGVLIIHPSLAPPAEPPLLTAEIKAWAEAPILPRATGYVRRWMADLGAQVKTGDLLAEIEAPEIEQELGKARADLAHAEAATDLAKTTAERWQELLKTTGVSEQETAEKVADFALKKAAADSARASVRRLEQLSGFSRISAPFDGTITARHVNVGELVSAGSNHELFHLADTSRLRVFVHVPQPYAENIAVGQPVELFPGDTGGRQVAARVARTARQLESASRTLLIELEIDNVDGRLLAGGFARVRLPTAHGDPVLTVPANTLIFHADGPQVGVVGTNNTVELRRIIVGRDRGPVLEVRGGLTAADRVILNPADSLSSGQTVQVREAPAPTAAKP